MSRVSLPVHAITITCMPDATVLTFVTMAAVSVVFAVLTYSEEEEDEEVQTEVGLRGGRKEEFSQSSWLRTSLLLKSFYGLLTQPSVVLLNFCDQP